MVLWFGLHEDMQEGQRGGVLSLHFVQIFMIYLNNFMSVLSVYNHYYLFYILLSYHLEAFRADSC